ncbi:hypothetical protein CCDG5_0146 [[Clostridium] cellulosi]|uniref:Uncharacterized protein n=1 Tax=[Clostridium] cellulosi TaxID=29343 RepID=A0A078KQ53_9FIRM|nr:MAG: hypothetical protein DIU81_01825 [[Clostridium] cellulosi]CDZ23290.1 hypothetical protein CCDG5_0146 [[Clostridium] cellulosi]
MEIVSRGGKPVIYKNNIQLRFFSSAIEDSEIKVNSIFAKIIDIGTVIVYGEYTVYLLYSYVNAEKQKVYVTQTQSINFSEMVSCNIPPDSDPESFRAEATFNPIITFSQAANTIWNFEIQGQIDVVIYASNNKEHEMSKSGIMHVENATAVRIGDANLPIKDLLEMDTAAVEKMLSASTDAQTAKKVSDDNKKEDGDTEEIK